MINLAVSHSLKHESASQQPAQLSYLALDGLVRLVVLLVNGEMFAPAARIPQRQAHMSTNRHTLPNDC